MNTIKFFFSALLFLSVSGTTYAQSNKFDIGVEGSPSITFLRGNTMIDNLHDATLGFSGGVFFQANLHRIISVRTGMAYERKASLVTAPTTDQYGMVNGEFTAGLNFDYLTLPVLARATVGKKVQYFVNAGPYFGYLLKATAISEGDNEPKRTEDITSHCKRFDTGITTGIGISVPIDPTFAFSFEVRNNLGLYNISAEEIINGGTIKTNSTNFLLSLAYKL